MGWSRDYAVTSRSPKEAGRKRIVYELGVGKSDEMESLPLAVDY